MYSYIRWITFTYPPSQTRHISRSIVRKHIGEKYQSPGNHNIKDALINRVMVGNREIGNPKILTYISEKINIERNVQHWKYLITVNSQGIPTGPIRIEKELGYIN